MQQSFWHLTGNLWALALSTAIALFLPDFGPEASMSGGVGVIIRTTMVAPIVFSLLYWAGRLLSYLIDKLKEWWFMSIITAGIEEGIRNAAERRAKEMVGRAVEQAVTEAVERAVPEAAYRAAEAAAKAATRVEAEKSTRAKEMEREAFIEFMRNKGVPSEEIDAFIRQLSQQG